MSFFGEGEAEFGDGFGSDEFDLGIPESFDLGQPDIFAGSSYLPEDLPTRPENEVPCIPRTCNDCGAEHLVTPTHAERRPPEGILDICPECLHKRVENGRHLLRKEGVFDEEL